MRDIFDAGVVQIREIEFQNDEYVYSEKLPEARWAFVRRWVVRQIQAAERRSARTEAKP